MKINVYRDIESVKKINSPIVSIGFFDGVHLGHKYLLKQLTEVSKKKGVDHLLISMWPHPRAIVQNIQTDNFLLNTLNEKIELFRNNNIKNLLILDFNKELAGISSEDFIKKILLDRLNASAILLGFNNSFGKQSSTTTQLGNIASKYPIELIKSEPCCKQFTDVEISSSAIRDLLLKGKVEEANQLLGYSYTWSGNVKNGYKVGRSLGFPTANLEALDINKIIPDTGVYLVYAHIGNKKMKGLLNIGYRPTFNRETKSVELHIIDFNQDIYDIDIKLEFVKYLRNEKLFDNVEALKKQLNKDLIEAVDFFSKKRGL
jgi:riboflavin kinase/FMN adenylyltransferase